MASILFTLESYVPSPVPWIRLGLANIVSILALKWWGMKEAMLILLLRVVLGSLLAGKFLQPVFIISFSGGIAATVTMGVLIYSKKRIFSLIGISILGALSKNIIQMFVAYLLYIIQIEILSLLPLFLFSSLITGVIIGFFAIINLDKLRLEFVE